MQRVDFSEHMKKPYAYQLKLLLKQKASEDYQCNICYNLPVQPMKCSIPACNKIICQNCLDKINQPNCPFCRQPGEFKRNEEVFNLIGEIPTLCQLNLCRKKLKINQLGEHAQSCINVTLKNLLKNFLDECKSEENKKNLREQELQENIKRLMQQVKEQKEELETQSNEIQSLKNQLFEKQKDNIIQSQKVIQLKKRKRDLKDQIYMYKQSNEGNTSSGTINKGNNKSYDKESYERNKQKQQKRSKQSKEKLCDN